MTNYLFVGTRHSGIVHLASALASDASDSVTYLPNRFIVHVIHHPIRVVNLLLQEGRFRHREPQDVWEETIYRRCSEIQSFLTQEDRAWAYYFFWNKSINGVYRNLLWRIEDNPKALCHFLGVTLDTIPLLTPAGSMKDVTPMSPIKRKVIDFVRQYRYHLCVL